MRITLRVLVCLFLCSSAAIAQKPSAGARVRTYVRTHKELLASDAIVSSAIFADVGSTINCQNFGPSCVETNDILGKHPSAGAVIGLGFAYTAAFITVDHLIWHFAPDGQSRHVIWFWTAPVAVSEAINVAHNVNVTQQLENEYNKAYNLSKARARLAH